MSNEFSMSNMSLIVGYGVPTIICLIDHLYKIFSLLKRDILLKRKGELYHPSIDVADTLLLIFAAICPVVNLFFLAFDIFPRFFEKFCAKFKQFLDRPLVKPNERPKTIY